MKNSITNLQVGCTNYARLFSIVIILSLVAPFITNAQTGKTDFSGSWKFNESKSELGDRGRRFGNGDIVARQDANLLTIEREFTRDGQTSTFTSKYDLGGKETTNSFGRGESKSAAKWSSDGQSLTVTTKMSFNGNERTSTDVWSLKDANTLSVASTRQGRDGGEMKTTRVYDKK